MNADLLVKTLRWPVLSLLIVGGVHFAEEVVLPDLRNVFGPPVLGPLVLAFGIWTGYRAIRFGGNYVDAAIAGAILGLLPLIVEYVGFGILLDRGTDAGTLGAVFGWDMVFWGALIGGGFALGRTEPAT